VTRILFLCLGLCLAATTHAQTHTDRFEITPFAGYTFGGTFNDSASSASVSLADSANFGLILNFREGPNTQWEIFYSLQQTDATASGVSTVTEPLDIDVHYLQAGGTYQGDGDRVRPFLAATVGAAHFDVKEDGFNSDTFFAFSIGPGLQINPSGRLGIRLEARAFGTLVKSGSAIFCESNPGGGSAGCAFTIVGEVLWQFQANAGVVFRF
jgi:opacity protein-like surface antigen